MQAPASPDEAHEAGEIADAEDTQQHQLPKGALVSALQERRMVAGSYAKALTGWNKQLHHEEVIVNESALEPAQACAQEVNKRAP